MRNGLRDDRRAEQVGRDRDRPRGRQGSASRTKLRLRPRVLTASALTGRNVTRLLVEAVALADRARGRIPTAELNRFVAEVPSRAPAARGARPAAADLLRDAGRDAARRAFACYVNDRELIVRDYAYFLENRLRQRYRLEGVPLVIDFADRERRGPRGAARAASRRAHERLRRALVARASRSTASLIAIVLIGGAARGRARWSQGRRRRRTPTTRSRLVPPNALLYVHVERRPRARASGATRAALLDKLPALARLRDQALGGLARRRGRRSSSSTQRPAVARRRGRARAAARRRAGRPR